MEQKEKKEMNLIHCKSIALSVRLAFAVICLAFFFLVPGCQSYTPYELYPRNFQPGFIVTDVIGLSHEKKILPWKKINLTGKSDYAGHWVVAGDIDNDMMVEIVSAKNYHHLNNHYTTSVAAFNLDNSILWEWGDPGAGQASCGYDVACQIYDLDNDNMMDIVIAGNKTLFVLDGATGREKWRFPIPAHASDCIVFANLTGGPRPEDILVKTRYSRIWAYTKEGTLLWEKGFPGGYKTAHQPFPVDIDRDGKDEIMAGYAMLNHDGSIRWVLDDKTLSLGTGHLDSCRIYKKGDSPKDFRLVITCCKDNAVAMINGTGKIIWKLTGYHFESIDIGNVSPDSPGDEILVDVDHRPWGESPAWLLSGRGDVLGILVTDRSRRHTLIDWEGKGLQSLIIGQAQAGFGYNGRKKIHFEIPGITFSSQNMIRCFNGYMTGDGAMDVCFLTEIKNDYTLFIFKNPSHSQTNHFELGTGSNVTLY
jgi:hypothetical protein